MAYFAHNLAADMLIREVRPELGLAKKQLQSLIVCHAGHAHYRTKSLGGRVAAREQAVDGCGKKDATSGKAVGSS